MSVRVRFAPSPTGYLHVGGLRTALYNFLFAKHHGGKIILRIEDTDRTRLVEKATENLISNLRWAGIDFDESPQYGGDFGPYVQSDRFALYSQYAKELLDSGNAYYAFDTAEELDEMRQRLQNEKKDPRYDRDNMKNSISLGLDKAQQMIDDGVEYVVRLKVPHEQMVEFHDIIRGDIKVQGKEVDDQVLLKSDGFPTYHLANVVDDHLMQISHVIRGEEWLPSTPKHVLLYQHFGWEAPQFAHLPLLLNKNKSKLSKRHGSVSVEDFRKKYLKAAFVNFVALLGWNPTADREIYSMDELIDMFDLSKVNKAGAVFDTQKLDWMNAQYLRKMPIEDLTEDAKSVLESAGFIGISKDYIKKVVELFIERISFLDELPEIAEYMFQSPKSYEEAYLNKHWKEDTEEILDNLIKWLESVDDFSHHTLYEGTKQWCEENGTKLKIVIHPLRLMITGRSTGAGMFETMEVLGKKECFDRINSFLKKKNDGTLVFS
jgi:glutamyl-tRNA synthetase